MKRTAVFVDAGYLYAQGSACLQGSKAKRESLKLDHLKFIKVLKVLAKACQPSAELLRIYWYDGTSRGPTQDHRTLADLDDLKLRLGFIHSVGQQKGVDSLLVTDLVELARNGAICDAILLGGDEDLRIGVQIAQSFGVRVHLIGIEPSRGSQSQQLRQESDTKREISGAQVKDFLSTAIPMVPPPAIVMAPPAMSAAGAAPLLVSVDSSASQVIASVATPPQSELETKLDQGIASILQTLDQSQMVWIEQALVDTLSVPAVYDRRVLAACRTALGRDLTMEEKKLMRVRFISRVRDLAQ
jgi:uncharacterized LabA/DUF88 family protein